MSKKAKKSAQADQVKRWNTEFTAAKKDIEPWWKKGDEIVDRFRDDRKSANREEKRWNLFSANVQTQMATLYGQMPHIDVSRRFNDAEDDDARVAGVILDRVLNCDVETPGDTYAQALWEALQDRMLPGFGMCRVRYERDEEVIAAEEEVRDEETGKIIAEAVPETNKLKREAAVVDYVPWRSHLWSPAKVFADVRWWAFETQMGRKELVKRFGAVGELVPLNSKSGERKTDTSKPETPWGRADVWEIWSKDDRKVYWYVEGFNQLLDERDDPLELEGFWPFPRPMIANLTTKTLVPVPDFKLAQDLYNEIDDLTTRIQLLVRAVRVAGVYDATNDSLKRLLSEAASNELIPEPKFAALMEKGGIATAIAWLPLEQIVKAITELVQQRSIAEQALYQVTGMSDLMRGQATPGGAKTATEQEIKAKFGSVRMTALQKDFARFASDLQRIKAEVISNFYDPQTLLDRSNIMMTPDKQFAEGAVELIKSKLALYRVEVKPESVSLEDFAGDRSEAAEFIEGLSKFMQAAAPVAEKLPGATLMLLELLQLVMTRFRFADEAEGILDRAIEQAKKAAAAPAPPQQVDPKIVAQQMKTQGELQKVQLEAEADVQRIGLEAQAEEQKQASQAQHNTQELIMKTQLEVQKAKAMPKPVVKPGGAS